MKPGGKLEPDADIGAVVCGFDREINYFKIQTVRSRRPAVLRRLHAIDARRLRERRPWVVSSSILRPFGDRDAPRMTWSP